MYAIYEETRLCESTFSDFKESKRCPSKSKWTTFKFNAGMSHIGLKNCVNPAIALPRIDTVVLKKTI